MTSRISPKRQLVDVEAPSMLEPPTAPQERRALLGATSSPSSAHAALCTPRSALLVLIALALALTALLQPGAMSPEGRAIVAKAAHRALGGGTAGAIAGVVQVLSLMWLRTTMNYQYRYGTSTCVAMRTLYDEGGFCRFYQGVSWALLNTPLARFGDTASNSGVLALLATSGLPLGVQTLFASGAAVLWRMCITPLDTLKTTLQVQERAGYAQLINKIRTNDTGVL